MKDTIFMGLFLAATSVGAAMLVGVEKAVASEISDPDQRSARA